MNFPRNPIRISSLVLGLSLLLTACPGPDTTPDPTPDPTPPPETQLTEANAWKGEVPGDAEMVTPEEFEKGLASGELELVSTAS